KKTNSKILTLHPVFSSHTQIGSLSLVSSHLNTFACRSVSLPPIVVDQSSSAAGRRPVITRSSCTRKARRLLFPIEKFLVLWSVNFRRSVAVRPLLVTSSGRSSSDASIFSVAPGFLLLWSGFGSIKETGTAVEYFHGAMKNFKNFN
ncbi:hypothetical protein Dsin_016053, partial [Dipteronia sinensis]